MATTTGVSTTAHIDTTPLGWSDVARSNRTAAERDFVEYVEAGQAALVRFAYLLTSDYQAAEDLVQTALAKTYLSWDRLRDRNAVDAYVRRIIVNENASIWRRAWRRKERPTEVLPEPAA